MLLALPRAGLDMAVVIDDCLDGNADAAEVVVLLKLLLYCGKDDFLHIVGRILYAVAG